MNDAQARLLDRFRSVLASDREILAMLGEGIRTHSGKDDTTDATKALFQERIDRMAALIASAEAGTLG